MRTKVKKYSSEPAEKYHYEERPLGAKEIKKIIWIPVIVVIAVAGILGLFLYVIHETGEGAGKAIESVDTFLYGADSYDRQERMLEEDLTEDELKALEEDEDLSSEFLKKKEKLLRQKD